MASSGIPWISLTFNTAVHLLYMAFENRSP